MSTMNFIKAQQFIINEFESRGRQYVFPKEFIELHQNINKAIQTLNLEIKWEPIESFVL